MEGKHWSVEYMAELNIILTKVIGEVVLQDVKEAILYSFELAKKHGTLKSLCDCREMITFNIDTTFDNYILAKFYDNLGIDRTLKEAILVNADDTNIRSSMAFFEIVAANQGYNIKVFTDEQKAMEWLINSV
ncbi:MAG: hypothetical protein JXR56_05375 [Candidatus Cloacimonetes bacterium]|nr:hypothetical protein [Candidatus Cloacimonadota bacterium]